MASIKLRPDGGLTVQTSPLPRLIGGVPVSIRSFALTLDRPGFILNASSLRGAGREARRSKASAGRSPRCPRRTHATDCAGLKFSPKLEATIGARGKTGVGSFPPLKAVITVPAGPGARRRSPTSRCPPTLGLDLKRLSKACAPAQFQAGACPASARIGTAVATTPLLDGAADEPGHAGLARPGRAARARAAAHRRGDAAAVRQGRRRSARTSASATRSPASRTCRSRSSS